MTGTLDLHGVEQAITFPATIRVGGDKVDNIGAVDLLRDEPPDAGA